jgi:hypothetical protein
MKTITKEQLAKILDGRNIRNEITDEEEKLAADNNLVIVFGGSDDLVEFRGAMYDETVCYGSAVVTISKEGIISNEDENENDPSVNELLEQSVKNGEAVTITAHWCGDGVDKTVFEAIGKPDWCYTNNFKADIASFRIYDPDEENYIYCVGIVFDLDEIFPQP